MSYKTPYLVFFTDPDTKREHRIDAELEVEYTQRFDPSHVGVVSFKDTVGRDINVAIDIDHHHRQEIAEHLRQDHEDREMDRLHERSKDA